MRADGNNTGLWMKGLLVAAIAVTSGCATESSDDGELRPGTYAITGFDLGSCEGDTWVKSATNMVSLEITFEAGAYVVNMCSDQGVCAPSSPSRYVWAEDRWRGEDGNAYLTDTGCVYQYVDATAHLDGDGLMIAADRWTTAVSGSSCTFDAKFDLTALPCSGRSRLLAVQQ